MQVTVVGVLEIKFGVVYDENDYFPSYVVQWLNQHFMETCFYCTFLDKLGEMNAYRQVVPVSASQVR
jgi:hypothetical protein